MNVHVGDHRVAWWWKRIMGKQISCMTLIGVHLTVHLVHSNKCEVCMYLLHVYCTMYMYVTLYMCIVHNVMGVPKQELGQFFLGLGLVVKDRPLELLRLTSKIPVQVPMNFTRFQWRRCSCSTSLVQTTAFIPRSPHPVILRTAPVV